ncbi:pretoxin HINT domain-containing protein [Haloactinospora alba]|uniref:Pretoxin HINT domain-containing protein n=1 Tax=Haloactinospora alba TaxID=405555 RepID=A0A543NM17_9ACTN|nr:pretoxin HINT domain-containing protein [Haloactinospora alba]
MWRAESGASLVEYAALVALASALVVALISAGLTTRVGAAVEEGLCLLYGEDGCAVEAGGNDSDGSDSGEGDSGEDQDSQDGDPNEGSGGSGGNDSEEGSGGDAGEDSGGDGSGEGQDSGDGDDSSEGEQVAYDPELTQEFEDAQEEVSEAEDEYESAKEDMEDLLTEDLPQLLGELIGIEDARKCFMEGDIEGCLWTLASAIPWSKAGKFVSKIPAIVKLGKKWNKLRKKKDTREDALEDKNDKLDEAQEACQVGDGGGGRNSFVAGTPVLLADGSRVAIEDVEAGDEVVAAAPGQRTTGARTVRATITGTGSKDLVSVAVFTPGGVQRVTATGGHRFWQAGAGAWSPAAELEPGDRLRGPDGRSHAVAFTRGYTQHQTVHNLTVTGLHTYYVGAGNGPSLLVHNDNGAPEGCNVPPQLNTSGKQFGKKIGKHAQDYGLDPSSSKDREWIKNHIEDISKNPEEVRKGNWNPEGGGASDNIFFRKGNDVVVTKNDGTFVTVLKDGTNNGWFKDASQYK